MRFTMLAAAAAFACAGPAVAQDFEDFTTGIGDDSFDLFDPIDEDDPPPALGLFSLALDADSGGPEWTLKLAPSLAYTTNATTQRGGEEDWSTGLTYSLAREQEFGNYTLTASVAGGLTDYLDDVGGDRSYASARLSIETPLRGDRNICAARSCEGGMTGVSSARLAARVSSIFNYADLYDAWGGTTYRAEFGVSRTDTFKRGNDTVSKTVYSAGYRHNVDIASDATSHVLLASASWQRTIGNGPWSVDAGIEADFTDRDAPSGDRTEWNGGANFGISRALSPTVQLRLGGSASARDSNIRSRQFSAFSAPLSLTIRVSH